MEDESCIPVLCKGRPIFADQVRVAFLAKRFLSFSLIFKWLDCTKPLHLASCSSLARISLYFFDLMPPSVVSTVRFFKTVSEQVSIALKGTVSSANYGPCQDLEPVRILYILRGAEVGNRRNLLRGGDIAWMEFCDDLGGA